MADKKEGKEKANKTASDAVEKIVDEVSGLTVLELSELVEALQDKLGVTPQMAQVAPSQAGQGASADEGEAPSETGGGTVVITASGDNKIAVIKAIREINQNLGLKEAKDLTENLPAEIIKDGKPDEAKEAAEKLKAAGATVELK